MKGDVYIRVVGTRLFLLRAMAPEDTFDRHGARFDQVAGSLMVNLNTGTEPLDTNAPAGRLLDSVGERVVGTRGLPSPTNFDRSFQTRREFQEVVETQVLGPATRREAEQLQDFCLLLDLCIPSDDLFKATVDLITLGVLGYYKPEQRSLTMVADGLDLDLFSIITYAHEYAHALQDSRFDLSSLSPVEETLDASKALAALKEGDAKLTEYLFYDSLPPSSRPWRRTCSRPRRGNSPAPRRQ